VKPAGLGASGGIRACRQMGVISRQQGRCEERRVRSHVR
jgi:hypothetical protein